MKPIFIRKYTPESERIADEFIQAYIEEGNKVEKNFAQQKTRHGINEDDVDGDVNNADTHRESDKRD